MMLPSSTSLSLLLLLVLGAVVFSVAAQATPCELGEAGCIKKGKKKNDERQRQQHALASNSSLKQINDTLPRTLVDEDEAANTVPAQEVHLNGHENHHAATQFDLSPPPLLKEEVEDPEYFPLLQERIASIQAYLQDPMFYLIDMDVDSYMHEADLSSYSIPPSNLVAVLEDLEFQLENNVTLALEFYTLGGWHIVASLVSPVAHGVASRHDDNDNNRNNADVNDKILVIRAYATSLLGAIVKSNSQHDEVVSSWVIAPVQIDDAHDMTTMRTTPLNLVAQAMVEVSSEDESAVPAAVEKKCRDNTIEYQHQLAKECMHTLDAFLNHGGKNAHSAHVAFSTLWTVVMPSSTSSSSTSSTVEESSSNSSSNSSSSPAKILGHQVAIWTQQAATTAADTESSNAPMSRHSIDMATRLLRLAKDIVQDVDNLEEQDDNNNENKIILNVLSTNDWCHSAMIASTLTPSSSFKRLVFSNLQKTALQALAKLGPHCSHYFHGHHDTNNNDNDNKDKPPHVGVADLMRLHEQLVLQASMTNDSDRSSSKRVVDGGQKEREREFIQLVEEALAAVTTTTTTTTILLPPGVVNEE